MLISRANNFHKSLFLRHFTICWDWGSTVLVWIVTGLLWSIPSGTAYWDLKLINRCRLSSTWWLCRGIRWKSMTTTVLTRSRWMSFSSKFLTNRGLQIMKESLVKILPFFLLPDLRSDFFNKKGNYVGISVDFIRITKTLQQFKVFNLNFLLI